MKATWIVHWPGKDVHACDEHAARLRAVGAHLGFAVSMSTYMVNDVKCTNCENEAESARAKMPKDYVDEAHSQECQLRYVTAEVARLEDWGCTCKK